MPQRLSASTPVALPRPAPAAAKKAATQSAPVAQGWTPTKSTADQRRLLDRTIDDAINLPAGASLRVRVGQVRAVVGTVGTDGTKLIEGRLSARLPARSAEERARILTVATALGVKTPALTQQLLKDAISAGDARFALELVYDGAILTKSHRAQLATQLEGDEVLMNSDATKNLSRAAVSVLADQPAELERFAKSLSTPVLLFTEVMSNKEHALAKALKPLVGLLSPQEADGLARGKANSAELTADLRARAKA